MEDYIEYLKDNEEYLSCNFTGNYKLNMVVRKWVIDLPTEDILPFKETWELVFQDNIITSIIRNSIVYTLCKQAKKDNFRYENDGSIISLHIRRDPGGNVAGVSGYFYKSNITCFTYDFWC